MIQQGGWKLGIALIHGEIASSPQGPRRAQRRRQDVIFIMFSPYRVTWVECEFSEQAF